MATKYSLEKCVTHAVAQHISIIGDISDTIAKVTELPKLRRQFSDLPISSKNEEDVCVESIFEVSFKLIDFACMLPVSPKFYTKCFHRNYKSEVFVRKIPESKDCMTI